jgi:hypothetical protein
MLPNEVFALACLAYYEEQGFVVNKENGIFAHCPLTRHECETGYYLLWEHHQHQGLLQSRDLDKCCFFAGDALKWLRECDYFPDDYFELWGIYEKYTYLSGEMRGKTNKEEKLGICNPATHRLPHVIEAKKENGRKVSAQFQKEGLGIFDPANKEKVIQGSIKSGRQAVERKTGIHDPSNRELVLQASTYARDNGVGVFDPANKEKVIQGSIKSGRQAVENKTGIFAPEYAERRGQVGRQALAQKWQSTVDGYVASAPLVARHNKANGWDPNARVRIS